MKAFLRDDVGSNIRDEMLGSHLCCGGEKGLMIAYLFLFLTPHFYAATRSDISKGGPIMFEQLFRRPTAVVRHRKAPLAEERARYLEYLSTQRYSRVTLVNIAERLLKITRVLHPQPGITQEQINEAAFKQGRPLPGKRSGKRELFKSAASRWLRFLGWVKPSREPLAHAPFIERFAAWMKEERGLSPVTIKVRCWHASKFFVWYEARHRQLKQLKPRDIDAFLQWSGTHGWSRRSISLRAAALRALTKYAGSMGWCSPSLAGAIQGPRLYAQEAVPSGLAWNEVARLLAKANTDDPCDIRDRAIIMLLAIYGLRSGEVAGLRLDDIDWERNRLLIRRPKVMRAQVYPLVPAVGQAIVRYLREVRPRSAYRELFLTLRAPIEPANRFYYRVRNRLDVLDIGVAHRGPHSLRHACAGHLLDEGFSLKEIADHLGHRSLQSTRIYAKIDLRGLGEVAAFDLGGLA